MCSAISDVLWRAAFRRRRPYNRKRVEDNAGLLARAVAPSGGTARARSPALSSTRLRLYGRRRRNAARQRTSLIAEHIHNGQQRRRRQNSPKAEEEAQQQGRQ